VIEADIEFLGAVDPDAAGFILFYAPATQAFITAMMGGYEMCAVRTWTGQWTTHASVGRADQLAVSRKYHFSVSVKGSQVRLVIDGVDALTAILPIPLPYGQAGIWCRGEKDIRITSFHIAKERPSVFVVMQFTPPFNELYSEVVKPVCEELDFLAVRADETYGPGIIIQDIERQILQAKIIVADITPANPNVYYEVGFAHALKKPTILIAEKPTALPFDVSPFRTLFYDNTIAGKARVHAGLRNHLEAIKSQLSASSASA
jgi:hypothetical protein